MAFNSIPTAWIASGKFAIQSMFQYIKDNFDTLYASITGTSTSDVPNGSFEVDSDLDGIADSWTQNLYAGGSATLDSSTQAVGTKSIKFTSPGGSGNGGGYYDSDYVPCNELRLVNLRFSHKSSVAGIHNQVILRWYTAAKVYISSTTIYNDAAANPTSWTQFIRGAVPVATARYFKVRLDSANSDDATAGSAWWDDVGMVGGVDTVVGFASGGGAGKADRIHIATEQSSSVVSGSGISGISGVKKGVAGGGNVEVDMRDSGTSMLIVTLALPAGNWTIYASGTMTDTPSVEHQLAAIAMREG